MNGAGLEFDNEKFLALRYSKEVIAEVTKQVYEVFETFKTATKKETKQDDF